MAKLTIIRLAVLAALLAVTACGPNYLRKPEDKPVDPWPLPLQGGAAG